MSEAHGPASSVLEDRGELLEFEVQAGVHGTRSFQGDPSVTLLETLRENGIPMDARCGGRGLCNRCAVTVTKGAVHTDEGPKGAGESVMSCRCRGDHQSGPLKVRVPSTSLLSEKSEVVADFLLPAPMAMPAIRRGAEVTGAHALAVDIGTTTVAVLGVDLATGDVFGRGSSLNGQVAFGEDVLTRIHLAGDPVKRAELQRAIAAETLVPLFDKALQGVRTPPDRIYLSGNTTMLHLLTGTDPSAMGHYPFTPTFLGRRVETAGTLGLSCRSVPAETPCVLLPGFAAFVGADITSGVIASGMDREPGPTLLVDVGTNGEILLKVGDEYLGTATAAGPAFEGRGLLSGARAAHGVVDAIRLEPQAPYFHFGVIGGGREPAGICGSAYVDFLAEGRRVGFLDGRAKMATALFDAWPGAHKKHNAYGRQALLGEQAAITELDLSALLQAKAAVGAGILTLLKVGGLTPADVKTLYLAGGFGFHLRLRNAIACGLLPGFREDQVKVIGNSSLGGAYLAARDPSVLDRMDAVRARTRCLELNQDPDFEDTYLEQLSL